VIVFLMVFVIFVSGCGTDKDKSVTGDFSDKNPSGLVNVNVTPDSVTVGKTFRRGIEDSRYALAGRYGNVEAFSVFTFNLNYVEIDSLIGAFLKFDVYDVWKDGVAEFELFETHSEWPDTLRIDSGSFLGELGSPISAASDTGIAFSELTFEIDPEIIRDVRDIKGFLVKSSSEGTSIVSLQTDNTNYPPVLKLISLSGEEYPDTSFVNSSKGTYYINTGIGGAKPVVSEGDKSGFALNIGLPESVLHLASINKCILKMSVSESTIPDPPMSIYVYKLDSQFTTIDSVDVDTQSSIIVEAFSDETYEIDITDIVNRWHIGGETNYGLIFQPNDNEISPNQLVFTPSDSLMITLTPLPEIE
jgi:hypothetical protein